VLLRVVPDLQERCDAALLDYHPFHNGTLRGLYDLWTRMVSGKPKPQYLESYVYLVVSDIHELDLGVRHGMVIVRFIRLLGAQSASIGSEKGYMTKRIPIVIWRIITGVTFPGVDG